MAKTCTELGGLKEYFAGLPNSMLLLSLAMLRESIASSDIENVNTTVEQALQQQLFPETEQRPADKEVLRYGQAMRWGFEQLPNLSLSSRLIMGIQQQLLPGGYAGYQQTPNQIVNLATKQPVYTPPPAHEISRLLGNWENFVHTTDERIDPLIACSIMHYQFEAIHPFGDENGRTGRILNVLYLVREGLLDIPVLYLNSHIVRTKADYYRLLQTVREQDCWEEWVLYVLQAVEQTATQTIATIHAIKAALFDYKLRIRNGYRFYSQDLINNLFTHPYTKIEFVQRDLSVSRLTATKYLDALTAAGFLRKQKIGRGNYYINLALNAVLQPRP